MKRSRRVLIGRGGDGSDGPPYYAAVATDIQITTENFYLELGEVKAGSDRLRKRWTTKLCCCCKYTDNDTWNLERSRRVLIGGGGDGSDGPPHCVAAAADIKVAMENSYLELGEGEAGSDRWRRRWK